MNRCDGCKLPFVVKLGFEPIAAFRSEREAKAYAQLVADALRTPGINWDSMMIPMDVWGPDE